MRAKGPWDAAHIQRFLAKERLPLHLACNGASGHPVMAALWFVPLGGRLWCATQRSARLTRHLARDPRCTFEVARDAPPYQGVRGQATAQLDTERGEAILRLLIDRYLGNARSEFARWLLGRADRETAIALEPRSVLSWDFTERMGDAV